MSEPRGGTRRLGLNPRALGENPRAKSKRLKFKAYIKKKAIESGDFYSTEEWRRLRYRVLRKSDGRCTLCGRSKPEHGVTLHVDHIKPRVHWPELAMVETNLQVLCADCNLGKGATDQRDWRA